MGREHRPEGESIEVVYDGPDSDPASVPSVLFANLVSATLDASESLARDGGESLTYTGFEISPGCTRAAVVPSDTAAANRYLRRSARLADGGDLTAASGRSRTAIHRLRKVVEQVPRRNSVRFCIGEELIDLRAAPSPERSLRAFRQMLTIRGVVGKVTIDQKKSYFTLKVPTKTLRGVGVSSDKKNVALRIHCPLGASQEASRLYGATVEAEVSLEVSELGKVLSARSDTITELGHAKSAEDTLRAWFAPLVDSVG